MPLNAGRSSGSTARTAGDEKKQDPHTAGGAAATKASPKGVSIAATSEQWAPPEQRLEGRADHKGLPQELDLGDEKAAAPELAQPSQTSPEPEQAPTPQPEPAPIAQPATPRRPSKRYPEQVQAALKSLRASLLAALQKKAQPDGLQYVRNLLLNAESYKPPEPKQRPFEQRALEKSSVDEEQNAKDDARIPKVHKSNLLSDADGVSEEINETGSEEIDETQKYEMRYDDDGVKPHTRMVRGSGTSPMRMALVETPASRKSAAIDVYGKSPGSSNKIGSSTSAPDNASRKSAAIDGGKVPGSSATKERNTSAPVNAPRQGESDYKLPPEWEIANSASTGKKYYYNTETGKSTWRHPGAPADAHVQDEETKRVNALVIVEVLQKDLGLHVFKKELRALLQVEGIGAASTSDVKDEVKDVTEVPKVEKTEGKEKQLVATGKPQGAAKKPAEEIKNELRALEKKVEETTKPSSPQEGEATDEGTDVGKDGAVKEAETGSRTLVVEALLDALCEERWWPTAEQIQSATAGELKKLRAELELVLGPKLASALADGQDIHYVRNLLDQAQSDRTAVEELKTFLHGMADPDWASSVPSTAGANESLQASAANGMDVSLTDSSASYLGGSTARPNTKTDPKTPSNRLPYEPTASPLRTGGSSPKKKSAKENEAKRDKHMTVDEENAAPNAGADGPTNPPRPGLKWVEVEEAPEGTLIRNAALAKALEERAKERVEFTKEELEAFNVTGLSFDSFIMVGLYRIFKVDAGPSTLKQTVQAKAEQEQALQTVQNKGKRKGVSPFLARITKPIVKQLSTNPPEVKRPFPIDQLPPPRHIPARHPEVEWTPWLNPKTGKVHEPIAVPPKSRGSSRARSREYSKLMGDATTDIRRSAQEEHNAYWRRAASPSHAIEYRRWYCLGSPVPGWSPHSSIPSLVQKTPWHEQKIDIPFKMGSRFTQRVGGLAPEKMTVMTMLIGDLKEERSRANFVVQGQDSLKSVRTLVMHGSYDQAVRNALDALHKFKVAGKYGAAFAQEINNAEDYVIALIKDDMDRLLAVTKDAVQRELFDKASEQIPKLRKANIWLAAKNVVYPPARQLTHKEVRDGISRESFPEGMGVVEELMQEIIKKAAANSQSLVMASLQKFFSAMRPQLELTDKDTMKSLKEAEERRNSFPPEIVTDGRSYHCVFDLKPPDMPDKLKIHQRVAVRGERTLASGAVNSGNDWMSGTITSWNQRASKYKVQYEDDYEWISWPPENNPAIEVEIDMYPEDVLITANGYNVRSITQEHPELGRKVAIVAFTLVPIGSNYNLYGNVDVSVKGVKSGKSLFADEVETLQVLILPPEILRPATCYLVHDSITNEPITTAIVEFVREDDEKFVFAGGETVQLDDGVYVMEVRGNAASGHPWTSYSTACVLVDGRTRAPENATSHVILNRHMSSPNELRIVLSWGAKPLELDAHVYTSEGAHVEYRDAGIMTNGIKLDMDSSAGYGPETVTIKVSAQLGYSFSVYWPGVGGSSDDWNASLATVTLYDSIGPVAVFHSPPPSLGSGSTEEKWWHIFGLDGSRWNSPGHGIVRVNQRMTHDLPQLALQGWTLVESLKRGMWEEFISQLAKTVQGTVAVHSTAATNDQPCMTTSRLALMTSLEGSTLLSLLCAHNLSTVAGGDQAKGDEDGRTPLQKQMEALKALLKGSVQLEKAAKSLAAMDGGIPHELALEKEIRLRGVRDSYIYRAVMYASADVAVHVLGVLVPVVQRSSMSAIIRQFFYTNGEDLLDMCVIKRTPDDLLAVLQALLAIEAVWERKPIRRFVENDQVLFEWPQDSGNWVKGVVHKCRADAHVIRMTSDPDLALSASNAAHTGCQWQPSDTGVVHDSLLADKLVRVNPSRLKWTSPALVRLKSLAENFLKDAKQMQIRAEGATPAQRQSMFAANVYKKAARIMAEKAFVEIDKEDKKRSSPYSGDVKDDN